MGTSRIITCSDCGAIAKNSGRELCRKCYMKYYTPPLVICAICGLELPHYAKGNCKKCHMALWKSTPEYKKRHAARQNARMKTPEGRASLKRYRQTQSFKDSLRKSTRKYYIKNADRRRESSRQYRENNKERIRNNIRAYKTKKRGLPATLTQDQWLQILAEWQYCCAYCGKQSDIFHREHQIPVSRGGGYVYENIVPACPTCNSRKRDRTAEEFLAHLELVEC